MSLNKLSKKNYELLSKYVDFNFDKSKYIDEELLKDLVRVSFEINSEIAVLISRKGKVLDFFLGDKSRILFNFDEKKYSLQKTRIVHTHPNCTSDLSELDLSLLKKHGFDSIAAVGFFDEKNASATVAYFENKKIVEKKIENAFYINKYGLIDSILENEKKYIKNSMIDNRAMTEKAILVFVNINEKDYDFENSKAELTSLAQTAGLIVVGELSQNRKFPDNKYYIGEGKLQELSELIQKSGASVVIFDNELSGSKQSNLFRALGVKIIDRSMLILDIFAQRAITNEGKIQVELAQLKYSLPRLSYFSQSSGRFGAGTGMRGPGETKLELNRRVVEKNIAKLTKQLDNIAQKNHQNRKNRAKNSFVVSIVGYTNSGKSSLLNLLAKENVYVKDELFATLDTTTRSVWLNNKTVLFTDTVGFISNLPHEFINAFNSTLSECVYADLLIHVVDISNPNYKKQMDVTINLLQSLGSDVPIITVYNKIDKINMDEIDAREDGIFVSVLKNQGINQLKNIIAEFIVS